MRDNIDFVEKFFSDARENERFSDSTLNRYREISMSLKSF